MLKILQTALIPLLLSSCSELHYVGQRNAPGTHADVYVTESAITKKYIIAGEGYLNFWAVRLRPDKIQALAEKTAEENGADGVIISSYLIPESGQAVNSVFRTDTLQRGVVTTASTTITPVASTGYRIYFIKYLH